VSLSALLLVAVALQPPTVAAERTHTVRSGQSLSRIARRYNVSVQALARANDMSVRDALREGQTLRIPEDGVIYVRSGDTLSTIARRHEVSVAALREANDLRGNTLQVGQRLVLPGNDDLEAREEAEARWGVPQHRGVARFFRVATRERLRVRLVASNRTPRRAAQRRLTWLFRHKRTNQQHPPHRRLVALLAQVSDHFGGREISILSAYRPPEDGGSRRESKHTSGRAVDMRIRGVPNRALRDYMRTLDQVGVGYYPNSTFVHFDVRERSSYWVDRSGPGEDAEYDREAARRGD